jgi:SAM-dependent methyltransferase
VAGTPGGLSAERDYFLGTHDEELVRLGLQHRVWRETVIDCWRRAGIGAGPGYAAADLAEIVGPSGSVVAVERSARFVEAGRKMLADHGFGNVAWHEIDLMADPLPGAGYDAAWCRWVACFVAEPAVLVDKIAAAVRPGGVAIFHEYLQYETLRIVPDCPCFGEFVHAVMVDWRASGGEPNVAPAVFARLQELGFSVREALPRVFCARPGEPAWQWPATFVDIHLRHQATTRGARPFASARGAVPFAAWADAVRAELAAAERNPAALMITPMVLEIVAAKPR